MELYKETINFYNAMASVCNDAKASQKFIKDTMKRLEEAHYVLSSRRDFQEIEDPSRPLGYPFSTVQYIDVDKDYCYTYDYRYSYYTKKAFGKLHEEKSLYSLKEDFRKYHQDCTENDIKALLDNTFVSVFLVRRWRDNNHRDTDRSILFTDGKGGFTYSFRFKYHDDNELFSVMRMLIAEDILKETSIDIFDIVPRIDVERDLD